MSMATALSPLVFIEYWDRERDSSFICGAVFRKRQFTFNVKALYLPHPGL